MTSPSGTRDRVDALDDRLLATITSPDEMTRRLGVLVSTAEVCRLKAGRRCLVRYATADGPMLGKVRVGHRPRKAFELAVALQRAGLEKGAADGIAVAEPVAVLDELGMWVQRMAPGRPGDEVLLTGDLASAQGLGRRAAEAAVRIHRSEVPARRVHGIADELAGLERRLTALRAARSWDAAQVAALADACRLRAAHVAAMDRPVVGIHRDYYPDQLILAGEHVTVIDFDLYCAGDPALDIGNFVGHVMELGLRHHGDAGHWRSAIDACIDRFAELSGPGDRAAVEAYTDLTLARHVSLSTELPGRAATTDALLELCRERFGAPLA